MIFGLLIPNIGNMYYICKSLKKVDMFKRGNFTVLLAVLIVLFQFGLKAQNSITGVVSYHNDAATPLESVKVNLCNLNGDVMETQFTNEGGKYVFNDLYGQDYLIRSEFDAPIGFNIDLDDILMLLDYLYGNINLEPIQLLAADVDGNGQVNFEDVIMIINTYYLMQQTYPVGEWVFTEDLVSVGGKDSGNTGGSGSGDINGVYSPDKNGVSISGLNYSSEVISKKSNELIHYKASLDNVKTNIGSYYLIMHYDEAIVNIESISSPIDGMRYIITDNEIRIIWVDENLEGVYFDQLSELFTLNMRLNGDNNTNTNNLFTIDPRSSIVDIDGNPLNGLYISFPTLNIIEPMEVEVSNYPNPCINHTYIEFNLPEGGAVSLVLTDARGQMVKSVITNEYYQAGSFIERIDMEDLKPGFYLYNLVFIGSEKMNYSGKIVFTE